MPITLDPSLPESLYPLAWLMGTWRGEGALHRPGDDAGDRRIEQELTCTAREDDTMSWTSLVHLVDTPAPIPPTSSFAKEDAPAPVDPGTGQRSLLLRETGLWTVGEPLPGQDLERARQAKPGDPEGVVSYGLSAVLNSEGVEHEWAGEVRGPRIQLARQGSGPGSPITDTRMFGYVGGRLMWLWERAPEQATANTGEEAADWPGAGLVPYLSLELDRV